LTFSPSLNIAAAGVGVVSGVESFATLRADASRGSAFLVLGAKFPSCDCSRFEPSVANKAELVKAVAEPELPPGRCKIFFTAAGEVETDFFRASLPSGGDACSSGSTSLSRAAFKPVSCFTTFEDKGGKSPAAGRKPGLRPGVAFVFVFDTFMGVRVRVISLSVVFLFPS